MLKQNILLLFVIGSIAMGQVNPKVKKGPLGINEYVTYEKEGVVDISSTAQATVRGRNSRNCADPDESAITLVCDGGTWQSEVSWEILDANDSLVASGGSPDTVESCLVSGNYTAYGYDSYGDGWNGNVLTGTSSDGSVFFH